MKTAFASTAHSLHPSISLPVRMAKLLWEHLALFIFASALLYMTVLPALLAFLFGMPLLTPWLATLLLFPTWHGIGLATRELLKGEEITWRGLLQLTLQNWFRAVRIGALPALLASVFMATNTILALYPHESWLYLPLFLDSCLTTLALLVSLTALSLPSRLHGRTLWTVALAVTRLQMAKQLGLLALFAVIGLLISVIFSASVLPLLCIPLIIGIEILTQYTCAPLLLSEQAVRTDSIL
jgi:hypothetical protein